MRRLGVMRHAKSSWDDRALSDFDRPLNSRGRKAAKRMGAELAARGMRFDRIIASPARRVRETLDRLALGYGALPPILFDDRIYASSEQTLLEIVRDLADSVAAPLLVGHNPGLHRLIANLGGGDAPVADHFPTAAFAAIAFPDARWADVGFSAGRLEALIVPRDLN